MSYEGVRTPLGRDGAHAAEDGDGVMADQANDEAAGENRDVLSRHVDGPDEIVSYGPLPAQVADWYAPESNFAPLVFLIHGGYWRPEYDRLHIRPLAVALRDAGFAVLSIEYRRIPGDPDATVSDVEVALAELPRTVGWLDRPARVVGHSAGGHLALWLASRSPVDRVGRTVALAPVTDLVSAERDELDADEVHIAAVRDFLGCPAVDRPDLDPMRMPSPEAPVTLVHGKADLHVPLSQSTTYTDLHKSATLEAVEGAGHFDLIDPMSDAFGTLLDVLI